jgi:cytochrome c-type biogenesis protein CcmH/NrfF
MTPPLAHAGHWAAQILYLMPVLAMVVALLWAKYRGRHRSAEKPEVPPASLTDRSE